MNLAHPFHALVSVNAGHRTSIRQFWQNNTSKQCFRDITRETERLIFGVKIKNN